MNIPRNRDGHPVTQAPVEHLELAAAIGHQSGQPVHPDILVQPTCPISRKLREGQEQRQQKTD